MTRILLAGAFGVLAAGCSLTPQLAPSAVGCYRLIADTLPTAVRAELVPSLPDMVRLDTIHGGQLQVPVSWLESQGYQRRVALLGLLRPEVTLRDGIVVWEPRPGKPLPPDSLSLAFASAGAQRLTVLLAAQPTGNWHGTAFMATTQSRLGQESLPVQLQRSECGSTVLGVTR